MQMTIDGLRQITDALRQYHEDWPNVTRIALEKAGAMVLEAVKANVPERTGEIKDNLVVTKVKQDRDATASIKIGVKKGSGAAHYIPLELGHINKNGTVTAPRPFLSTTYEETKTNAYGIIKDTYREEMAKRGG